MPSDTFWDTFWGVLLGGVIAVASNFVLHRTQLGREREARREDRRGAARDRKRDALFELQDIVQRLEDVSVEAGLRALEGTPDMEAPFEVLKLRSRVGMMLARIGDDATAERAKRAADVASVAFGISNKSQLADISKKIGDAMREFDRRVGELLARARGGIG